MNNQNKSRQNIYKTHKKSARELINLKLFNTSSANDENNITNLWNNDCNLNVNNLWDDSISDGRIGIDIEVDEISNTSDIRHEYILDPQAKLRLWALKQKISLQALTELLKILNNDFNLNLPNDGRTLLKTNRTAPILTQVSPGQYYHHGILEPLLRKLDIVKPIVPISYLNFYVNIDGLPINNSTSDCVWPVQIHVPELNDFVYICGLYYGRKKPDSFNEFLSQFVNELSYLLLNGFEYNHQHIQIHFLGFICDAPAMSEVKYVKPFNSYSGCTKCTIKGLYSRNMYFKGEGEPRTDTSFRLRSHPQHHREERSFIEKCSINMVDDFLLDPMHIVYLGVMKKLLVFWIEGRKKRDRITFTEDGVTYQYVKLSQEKMYEIDMNINNIKNQICTDFARKPRSIKHFKLWKATEYRMLLLYTGPVLLRNIIDENLYKHFLYLHVAIFMLSSEECQLNLDTADVLLKDFVKNVPSLYNNNFVVYNIHSLLHLPNEVKKCGRLDNFSAFKFENNLGKIKNLIRSPSNPLAQIINRTFELEYLDTNIQINELENQLSCEWSSGPMIFHNQTHYKKCKLPSTNLIINGKDNFILHEKKYFEIKNFTYKNNEIVACGLYYTNLQPLYTNPINSLKLNIGFCEKSDFSKELNNVIITNNVKKALKIDLNNKIFLTPLLH